MGYAWTCLSGQFTGLQYLQTCIVIQLTCFFFVNSWYLRPDQWPVKLTSTVLILSAQFGCIEPELQYRYWNLTLDLVPCTKTGVCLYKYFLLEDLEQGQPQTVPLATSSPRMTNHDNTSSSTSSDIPPVLPKKVRQPQQPQQTRKISTYDNVFLPNFPTFQVICLCYCEMACAQESARAWQIKTNNNFRAKM